MRALAFGGGTDSTGVLCGWVEKGLVEKEPIDVILFADTGNERPHTYEHIARMNDWLPRYGLPQIKVVRKGGNGRTLEEDCLAKSMLPSLAYGRKGCSHKFKQEPQEKFFNNYPTRKEARTRWQRGEKIEKLIGYEFREQRRWMKAKVEDDKYFYRFPLVEWEWSRPECIAAIQRMGLPLPGKSSCFFCPASTKPEIDELKRSYPLLFHRALALEDKARAAGGLKTVQGLGRRFAWRDYATTTEEPDVQPCMVCVDEG